MLKGFAETLLVGFWRHYFVCLLLYKLLEHVMH